MSHLAISSFSLHTALGPLTVEQRREDGSIEPVVIDLPRMITIEEFIASVRQKTGAGAVELCQIQLGSAAPERIQRLREALDAADIRLLTLPIDIGDLGHVNADWRAEDERRSLVWFEAACQLGASYVRVNAGAPGTSIAPDAWNGLVGSLRSLGDAASAMGLRLLVENHGGASSTPAFLRALLDEVGHDRLGLLLDMGNFEPLVALSQARFFDPGVEDEGLDLEPVYAAIAELAPIASLVHAKSVDPARDGTPLPNLSRALTIVAEAGYKGSISIEWEGRQGDAWERTAAMVDEVRTHFAHLA